MTLRAIIPEPYRTQPHPLRCWFWHCGLGDDDQRTGSGLVRIRLVPGHAVELHSGGNREEGWSHRRDRYALSDDGLVVTHSAEWRSLDCDGRLDGGFTRWTRASWVRRHPEDEAPKWIDGDPDDENAPTHWQRDHAAEAAGY